MPSPHFNLKSQPLSPIFATAALAKIWKQKVRHFQNRQLLFDLYENLDFHSDAWKQCDQIKEIVLSGMYSPTSTVRVAVEKSKGLCRHLTVPNARDALVLQALSDSIYGKVKSAAPSPKAFFEQKETPFSKSSGKLGEDDIYMYGPMASWIKFQKEVLGFSSFRRYIISTDIANFYDFIGHRHLRNIIASICNDVNEFTLDALIYSVTSLIWHPEYMPRAEIALPQMDSDAPRVLAHAFLYEADAFLTTRDCDFARFMDDIDIGVDDIATAKAILRDLDITLKSRGVRLNSGKTHILDRDEASAYFCSKENRVLNIVASHSNNKIHKNRLYFNILRAHFIKKYRKDKFSFGQEEKILKRYINLFSQQKLQIPHKIIMDILKNRPGVRQNIFSHLSVFGLQKRYLEEGLALLNKGLWVDDASAHFFAKYIVDARFKNNKKNLDIIRSTYRYLTSSSSNSRRLSGLWIASKFATTKELFLLVRDSQNAWVSNPDMGRFVGSLIVRIAGSQYEDQFRRIVMQSHNREAVNAARFGWHVSRSPMALKRVMPNLKSPNNSLPNKITHSKALLILCALNNPNLDKHMKAQLEKHDFRTLDAAYKILA